MTRREAIWAGLIVLLGLAARLHGITEQPPQRDETLAAFSAESYCRHGLLGPTMPFHPNLRNLVLGASTSWLGTGVIGLRGPSLLLGVLSIPLLGLLVLRLTGDRRAALLAALLLAIDPVHISFSRQALQEVHTTFLFLLGVWLFLRALDSDWRLRPSAWLLVAGLAFGLSAASKHHGLVPLFVCLVFALYRAVHQKDRLLALQVGVSLALVPATVYLLTYLPWLLRGYGLSEGLAMQLALLGEMVRHQGYATSSPLDSKPWQWFVRPLMGYGSFTHQEGRPFVTIAMGNPLVWLAVLPASVGLWRSERAHPGVRLLLFLFWVCYLPLALSPRPIWLLSSLAVTPFAFGLVARQLSRLAAGHRGWLAVYLGLAVAVSLLLYPMAIGRGWDYQYLRPLVGRFAPH